MSTEQEYREYCEAKKEIGEEPLTKEQFDEFNRICSVSCIQKDGVTE